MAMGPRPAQEVAAIDLRTPNVDDGPRAATDGASNGSTPPRAEHPSPPSPTSSAQFVRGDRFCRCCGVNLIGSGIEREPHYGLMAATCPACTTVNPVVVYPHLGRWTARWAAFFAGMTLLLLILVLLGGTASLIGMDYAIAEEMSRPLRYEVQSEFDTWLTNRYPNDPNRRYWNHQPEDMEAWIKSGGLVRIGLGAIFDSLGPEELLIIFFGLLAALAQGVVLAILLMRANWKRRVAVTAAAWLLVMIVALIITIPLWWSDRPGTIYYWLESRLVWPVWVAAQLVTLGTVLIGVLSGRWLARLLVSAMLGPRSRAALAVLWTTDGLAPPRR